MQKLGTFISNFKCYNGTELPMKLSPEQLYVYFGMFNQDYHHVLAPTIIKDSATDQRAPFQIHLH